MGEFYESTYFKSEEEMITRMRDYLSLEDILSGFENTIKIVDACKNADDYGLFHSTIIPQRKLPPFEIGGGFAPFYTSALPLLIAPLVLMNKTGFVWPNVNEEPERSVSLLHLNWQSALILSCNKCSQFQSS